MSGYEITGQELLQYAGSEELPYPARCKEDALRAIGAIYHDLPMIPTRLAVSGSPNFLKVEASYPVPTRKDHSLLGPENRLADKATALVRGALKAKNGSFIHKLLLPPLEVIAEKGSSEKSN